MKTDTIVLSAEEIRKSEENHSSVQLMGNAAMALYNALPNKGGKTVIVCGSGNNGGDGWALGCLLKKNVTVIYISYPKTEISKFYFDRYMGKKICFTSSEAEAASEMLSAEAIVDCLFGIGLTREIEGVYSKIVDCINNSDAYVISADIPSGLYADSTLVPKHVKPNETVTFTARKLSSAVAPSCFEYGNITVADVGIDISSSISLCTLSDIDTLKLLKCRSPMSHKGTYGTLKMLCGSRNMPGAGYLPAISSLRFGVGLLKVFANEELLNLYKIKLNECVFRNYSPELFVEERATAALIGCGISNEFDNDLENIFTKTKCPLIIDADGINFISRNIDILKRLPEGTILTPHPGEMARLVGIDASQIEKDRFYICKKFAEEYKITLLLKGANTVIASGISGKVQINTTGNPGLSKGGSGDVLAGMISSLSAQGYSSFESCVIGAYLHGAAADLLKERYGYLSFLPSDLPMAAGEILSGSKNI